MMSHKREASLWPRTLLWLIGLSGFFFFSYGLANHITSLRSDVGSVVFNWEHFIPLWSWTIVPYWSIDALYGLAILMACTRKELDTLGRRLLSAQVICVGCFLLFPLHFTFERPHLDGFFGTLFDLLMGFDKPFNQAPSLHITLLVILWVFYSQHIKGYWRWLLHGWFFLIGLSVLTTWQHHFFDVPTGVLAGCLCIWLWPDNSSSPLLAKAYPKQWKLFFIYTMVACINALVSLYLGGLWLWLCWLSVAFLLVALNYAFFGAVGFQKQDNGRFSFPAFLLYTPYFIVAWVNSRLWTRNNNNADCVVGNVYLGRIPCPSTINQYQFSGVVDLCAELPMTCYVERYRLIPVLDLTMPPISIFDEAVKAIDAYQQQGHVLVCCALGYSRSAQAVLAWLLWSKHAATVKEALEILKKARPTVVISQVQQKNLEAWWATKHE
ncbi:PAP2 phosphatase family protein [Entomomonas moraniae]|uniref:PAP2 phosphatase family protein n=1 Tax=Entomomonas moraniae TaxID=2213226 RepID=A0A3Q9JM00_9GAMM|nr:phosphatase PAP2/dual specificity phosphatase family protein [Entomomonas moraniae]AZS51072.1 PAP2 phosphatase family protein [Entomomonas moraniae]